MPTQLSEADLDPMRPVRIDAFRVLIWLSGIASLLIALHLAGLSLRHVGDDHALVRIARKFHLNNENSLPTFYSGVLLLSCGVLLNLIAMHQRRTGGRQSRHWTVLGFIFFYLACDETSGLHEMMNKPAVSLLHPSGIFHFAWVIPGIVIVILLGLAYLRFLIGLPPETRRRFILAACLYVGGAIGVEMIGARHIESVGDDLAYGYIVALEEAMEMFGAITFIYALLKYLQLHFPQMTLQFGAPAERVSSAASTPQCEANRPAVVDAT